MLADYAPSTWWRMSSSSGTILISCCPRTFTFPGLTTTSSQNPALGTFVSINGCFWPVFVSLFNPSPRELLCYHQLSLFQVMPNGCRFFLASYMIWPEINPRLEMSIPEFFAICRPVYSKTGILAFTVSAKQQFITIKQLYSNNKN
jgi:hypothetical protein